MTMLVIFLLIELVCDHWSYIHTYIRTYIRGHSRRFIDVLYSVCF